MGDSADMPKKSELPGVGVSRKVWPGDSSAVVVKSSELYDQSEREKLVPYIRRLWRYRHFVVEDARHRAFTGHQDKYLGRLWILLEPLIFAALYGTMFGVILDTSRGIENFIGYVIIGTTFFRMFQQALGSGSGLIKSSRSLIVSFNFPRSAVVMGAWIRNVLVSVVPALVAISLAIFTQWGQFPGWEILAVVPLFILAQVFSLGLTFITARLTVVVPDAKSLIPALGRAWFYISGVFFLPSRFDNAEAVQAAMEMNPAYRFLDAVRGAVMYQTLPTVNQWLYLCAWSIATVTIGFLYFWRGEGRYAQV